VYLERCGHSERLQAALALHILATNDDEGSFDWQVSILADPISSMLLAADPAFAAVGPLGTMALWAEGLWPDFDDSEWDDDDNATAATPLTRSTGTRSSISRPQLSPTYSTTRAARRAPATNPARLRRCIRCDALWLSLSLSLSLSLLQRLGCQSDHEQVEGQP